MICLIKVQSTVGLCITYKVTWVNNNRDYIVKYDSKHSTVKCSCKSFGVLCSHALRIDYNDLGEVPYMYILKRWSKNGKKTSGGISD